MIPRFTKNYKGSDKEYVVNNIWPKVKKVASKIPFVKDVIAMFYCAVDNKTPTHVRLMAFGALAYFISPLDIIPDTIPGLGYTDDAGVITSTVIAMGPHITEEHREKARVWLEGNIEIN